MKIYVFLMLLVAMPLLGMKNIIERKPSKSGHSITYIKKDESGTISVNRLKTPSNYHFSGYRCNQQGGGLTFLKDVKMLQAKWLEFHTQYEKLHKQQ